MSGNDVKPVVPFNLTLFIFTPKTCEYLGSSVSSEGLFQNDDPLKHPLPTLLLQLGTAIVLTTILHHILKPLHQPRFVAEMLAGILLGPSILQHLDWAGFYGNMFSFKQTKLMRLLEYISLGMYGYIVGVRTDVSMIKTSGKLSWIIGVLGFLIPLVIAYSTNIYLGKFFISKSEAADLMPICLLASSSYFHVTSILLEELNLLNSEIGRLALSSSLISSLFSWIYSICTNYYYYANFYKLTKLVYLERQTYRIILALFIIFALRPVMFWMIRKVPEGKCIKEAHFFGMVVMLFGVGFLSESLGYTAFFGMMILGLAVPAGPPLGSGMLRRLKLFVSTVLLPSFVVNVGHIVDVFAMKADDKVIMTVVIICMASYLGKIVVTVIPLRFCKMPYADAFALALIVSTQGLFDVFFIKVSASYGLLRRESYSVITLISVLIASFSTPIISHLYDPSKRYINYKRRTLQHSRHEHELRMLVCVHEEDHVFSIMNVLKASYPHKKNPIEAIVLDMMELNGRENPLLINHQFHKGRSSTLTRADRIITAFQQFELHHEGLKHQHFTSIAPYTSMHDDICLLALREDRILVDPPISQLRERHRGPDSREALALAMRMVENPAIRLTVIRLIAEDDFITDLLETKLDVRVIAELENLYKNEMDIEYREVIAKDGANTVEVLNSLDDQYDLLLVGRRLDSESPLVAGLTDWSFAAELGIIGDILVSSDMKCNASVLVLQQQTTVEDLLNIQKE
ncbi:hypothetical protein HYC85_022512 [Camellia sinensis]|uniref:Cation/H+ exchanger domain-containing protein n=1 Tax=Camellia sinensis TaxID=4442 RepID=A0A7J7GM96_CAMSI|nr:hypothetical protein HYC85_022512 [Camellia sinensis]